MRSCLVIAAALAVTAPARAGLPSFPGALGAPGPLGGFATGGAPGPDDLGPTVALPARADEPLVVSDDASGVAVAVTLEGAHAVPADALGPRRHFAAALALGDGDDDRADVSVARVPGGVEDWVHIARAPAREVLAYRVAVRAAGVRQIGDTLELLDAGGAPRLRMDAPTLRDARGAEHPARVTLVGCAVDRDPRPPWGRPVTAPGADACRLEVAWGADIGDAVAYPIAVDPRWGATKDMLKRHYDHMAVALPGDRLLVAGGYSVYASSSYQAEAEVYDGATQTWAMTGYMTRPRANTQALYLEAGPLAGQVFVAAGDDGLRPTAEVWDPATGVWNAVADMHVPRDVAQAAVVGAGQVLVAGGCSAYDTTCRTVEASSEVFDPETGTWTLSETAMSDPRAYFTLTTLADGRALAAGGCTKYSTHALLCTTTTASSDVFDPKTGAWTAAPDLPTGAQNHVALRLGDGTVLVAGGTRNAVLSRKSARFDPATGAWSAQGDLGADHTVAAATVLTDGRALIAGSWGIKAGAAFEASFGRHAADTVTSRETELFDPASGTWSFGPNLAVSRGGAAASTLGDGTAIVTGGLVEVVGTVAALMSVEVLLVDDAGSAAPPELVGSCGRCAVASCEAELTACAADATCAPRLDCFALCGAGPEALDCIAACTATCGAASAAFDDLTECVASTQCYIPCYDTKPSTTTPACQPEIGEPAPEPAPESAEPTPEPEPAASAEPDAAPTHDVASDGSAHGGCAAGGPDAGAWLALGLALIASRLTRRGAVAAR